jgi:hypothetical protein
MSNDSYPYVVYIDVVSNSEILNLLHGHAVTLIDSERMYKLSNTHFVHTDFLAESIFSKLFKEKVYCELHVAFQDSEISIEEDVTRIFSISDTCPIPCTFDHPDNQVLIPLEKNELTVVDRTRTNMFTLPLPKHLAYIAISKNPILRNYLEMNTGAIEFPPLKKFEKLDSSGPLFGYSIN